MQDAPCTLFLQVKLSAVPQELRRLLVGDHQQVRELTQTKKNHQMTLSHAGDMTPMTESHLVVLPVVAHIVNRQ